MLLHEKVFLSTHYIIPAFHATIRRHQSPGAMIPKQCDFILLTLKYSLYQQQSLIPVYFLNYNRIHDNCGFACGVSKTREDHVAQDYAEQGLSTEVSRRIPHTAAAHRAGPTHTPHCKAVSHRLQIKSSSDTSIVCLIPGP